MDRTQDLITCLWTFYLIIHLNHVKRRVLTLEQERFDLRSWKGLKLVSRTQMPYCRSRNALLVEGMHQYSISCFSVLPHESYICRIFFLKLALFRRRKEQNIYICFLEVALLFTAASHFADRFNYTVIRHKCLWNKRRFIHSVFTDRQKSFSFPEYLIRVLKFRSQQATMLEVLHISQF